MESSEHFEYLARRRRNKMLVGSGLLCLAVTGFWLANRNAREHWLERAPVTALIQAAERAGHDEGLAYHAAFRAYKEGRNADARRLMSALVKRNPRNAAYWSGLGRIAAADGDAPEAVRAYRKALELDPNLPYPRYYVAHIYAAAGLYTDAIREYSEGIRREPEFSENPEPYARALYEKGRYQESWDFLSAHFDAVRAQDEAYVLAARLAEKLGLQKQMRERLLQRIKFTAMYPVASVRVALGRMILQQSRDRKSLQDAAVLAEDAVRERTPEAFAFLAEVRVHQGDMQGARKALADGFRLNPADPDCLRAQVLLFEKSGMPARAADARERATGESAQVRALRRRLARNPGDLDIRLELARALLKQGRAGAAGEECHEVLSRSPGHPAALQLLEQAHARAIAALEESARDAPVVPHHGS